MSDEAPKQAKQVIVMRKDLGMRKGKMIAQGAHASLKVLTDRRRSVDDDTFAIALTVWVFGWTGGKSLVMESYSGAKEKVAEQKEQRSEKKATKRAERKARRAARHHRSDDA